MQYWLLKTEPEEWSWKQQVKSANEGAEWSGVRNFQASKNLRNMKIGDKCFFYHTGKTKSIIGIVKVIKEAFLDKTDKKKRFVAVQVRFVEKFKSPISLQKIKKIKAISHLPLLKQSRLSVMPIDSKSWKIICKMGKII